MTDDEVRHMNVLLESIKQEVRLVREGHQVLDAKIDRLDQKLERTRLDLKSDIAAVAHRTARVENEVLSLRGILAKLTELMDNHDQWLREHEVRLKSLESR